MGFRCAAGEYEVERAEGGGVKVVKVWLIGGISVDIKCDTWAANSQAGWWYATIENRLVAGFSERHMLGWEVA